MFSLKKQCSNIPLFVLVLVTVGYIFYTYKKTQPKNTTGTTYRIAIFEPALHPAIEEIAQGFMDTMNAKGLAAGITYEYTEYNATGNKILMQAQAQEILRGDYDLVFTIGFNPSFMAKEACAKKQCSIPLVFGGVDSRQGNQLTGTTTTGVTSSTNYKKQLGLLLEMMPSIKTVLLVYDPAQASGLEKDKQEITSVLQEQGISLRAVEVASVGETQQKVSGFIPEADVVMILQDHTTVSGIDSIITLCDRYHVPLLGSDLNSGVKGAVLAYGIKEYESGVGGAQLAHQILAHGAKPSHLPIEPIKDVRMKINRAKMASQGLKVDVAALPDNVEMQ
jgi:putative ABC transport system substrate-binding protein